jgi:hypothetical protein
MGGAAALALLGCSDGADPTGSGGAGGADAGSGGAGGGSSVPRDLEIGFESHPLADPDELLVMLNHVDGSLAESWLGSALPVTTSAVDGDFVTYAHRTNAPDQVMRSYRVSPGVDRIEASASLAIDPALDCTLEKMHVTVHVPAVADGFSAFVQSSSGHFAQLLDLPGDAEVDVSACTGTTPPIVAVLTTIRGANGFVAFELTQDIPWAPTTSVEITPTFATAPRAAIAFEVDDVADAVEGFVSGDWSGDFDPLGDGARFTPNEPGLTETFAIDGPFTRTVSPMDLPLGHQLGGAIVTFADDGAACRRTGEVFRLGASAEPIVFHADELAEPLSTGGLDWQLDPAGTLGDVATLIAHQGSTAWSFYEDPRHSYPKAPPAFPSVVPEGFVVPSDSWTLLSLNHEDYEELPSYAELVRTPTLPSQFTLRARHRVLVCN